MTWLRNHTLYAAWVISLCALLGSLYYGEVLDMEPCRLCWYQRIGMFPLPLFLGIATFRDDHRIAYYCLPLVAFGGLFAIYQSLVQIFPALHHAALCGHSSYCTVASPIPFLSALSFISIALLIFLAGKNNSQ
jgi:disulfide bond formation protein DsbB